MTATRGTTPFMLTSLRGGMNNSDPSIALPNDQSTLALNVEYVESMLGERRLGTSAITLPSSLSGKDRVTFLYRHIPDVDETAAELWAFGVTGTSAYQMARKTSSWADITLGPASGDEPLLTSNYPYRLAAQSIHGKIILAYKSSVDRLHVVDAGSTTGRRLGLAPPAAAPTVADSGTAGSFRGWRIYRVRYAVQSSGTTILRSEPSPPEDINPSGTKHGVVITKPASISEGETHWEIEASIRGGDYYRIATVAVGTTTYTDTQDYEQGYAVDFTLSENVGNYTVFPSTRYLCVDEDRLLGGGDWEETQYSSRIICSPPLKAYGVGNEERYELGTDPIIDLDGLEGGGLSGLSQSAIGTVWAFKLKGIYKLIRSGNRLRPYDVVCYTKERGALHGSVVPGVDFLGRPCVYFIDPEIGPCCIGVGGLRQCGLDIRTSWRTRNLEATKVVCSGIFYPTKKQVIWNIATGSSNVPDLSLVLHTEHMREAEDGWRRGWVLWNGDRAKALAMCMFSDNIESNTTRSRTLKPFIALEGLGLVHISDAAVATDNSVAYAARIVTKAYTLKNLLNHFEVMWGALLAKAVTGAQITLKLIRDFGLETSKTVSDISLAPTASETDVIRTLDNFSGAELRVAQFEFVDVASPSAQFQLNQLVLLETLGQEA